MPYRSRTWTPSFGTRLARGASTRARRGWTAALALTLACGTSSLGPVEPEDVVIRLAVSGGFAGVDYSLVVDGAAREVRGESCASGCDFEPGDLLAGISASQVETLAELLEDAGILAYDDRDFGNQCCDQFHYTIAYTRGSREARVRGSSEVLPPDLRDAAGALHALVSGRLQTLVAFDTSPDDWPRDPLSLGEVAVSGDVLSAEVGYSGGCEVHRLDLVAWGGWLESFPVQVNVLISHDDADDPCDAFLMDELEFSLTPLRKAYGVAYGTSSEPTTIILRIRDPQSTDPPGLRLVEYVF